MKIGALASRRNEGLEVVLIFVAARNSAGVRDVTVREAGRFTEIRGVFGSEPSVIPAKRRYVCYYNHHVQ